MRISSRFTLSRISYKDFCFIPPPMGWTPLMTSDKSLFLNEPNVQCHQFVQNSCLSQFSLKYSVLISIAKCCSEASQRSPSLFSFAGYCRPLRSLVRRLLFVMLVRTTTPICHHWTLPVKCPSLFSACRHSLWVFLHPSPSSKSFPTLRALELGVLLKGHCCEPRYTNLEIQNDLFACVCVHII